MPSFSGEPYARIIIIYNVRKIPLLFLLYPRRRGRWRSRCCHSRTRIRYSTPHRWSETMWLLSRRRGRSCIRVVCASQRSKEVLGGRSIDIISQFLSEWFICPMFSSMSWTIKQKQQNTYLQTCRRGRFRIVC